MKIHRYLMINRSASATVGRDLGLDCLASGTDQLDVLAAVHAEGVAPGHAPGEDEQAQAPEDSHAADCFSGNVASVFSTGGAGGPITTIVVVTSTDGDDHGGLLSGCGRGVHGLWSVHGLHGLHGSTVHESCYKINMQAQLNVIDLKIYSQLQLTFPFSTLRLFFYFCGSRLIYDQILTKYMSSYHLVLCLTLLVLALGQEYQKTELLKDWEMKILKGPGLIPERKDKVFKTSIPTTVHLDLLEAGQILDPFLKENYPGVKWVSDCDYIYSTNFSVDAKTIKFAHHKLTFEGIDTYAEVTLNGKKILTTENAFRTYHAYVDGLLKEGANKLQVKINSTNEEDTQGQQKNQMPFQYAHTRKACYQYSWDWAPYLNTVGIWKDVFLESFNEIKLDYVWLRTRAISKAKATVNIAIAIENPSKEIQEDYEFRILQDEKLVATFPVSDKYSYYDVQVPDPKLWWPNGIGEPYIYDFKVQLFKKTPSTLVDQREIPFGIRTVALDLTDRKFEVKVNGYPVYCKGANYVPPDMFYPRLTNSRFTPGNTIEKLIEAAVDSNFNMIRVWGGGQYESDKFLELASRKGIMLFYDFMFSDSIYPSSENFLVNVEQEIKEQIRRARNYPALTLWSGNNQILQGINDWGWSSQKYKDDYHRLFEILIPKIIEYESPYIPYIPSSPVYGVGNYGLERGGDVHFWSVWAGGAGFESYQTSIGRFNSEFGTQALPVWETIVQTMSESPNYQNSALLLHERHNSRFNTLINYMTQYMKKSINFEMETYQSGLLQAFAIQLAIKAHRVAKPNSFGTLYWQFNDAWPAISWSSIDYLGRWKPLQYMAKRSYPDVAIFFIKDAIHAVNDKLYPVSVLVMIEFFHLNGTLLSKIEKDYTLEANSVTLIHKVEAEDYKDAKKEEAMIYSEIVAGKNQEMTSTHFNVRFKELTLYPAEIEIQFHPEFNVMVLETKKTVVKNMFISGKSKYIRTSNNYFDLVPGHPVKVLLEDGIKLSDVKDDLVFRSYREVYLEDSKLVVKDTTVSSSA